MSKFKRAATENFWICDPHYDGAVSLLDEGPFVNLQTGDKDLARTWEGLCLSQEIRIIDCEDTMDIYTATMIAEGVQDPENEEQAIEAWQRLIDTGICWQLQGYFGRTATQMIESGLCSPPATEDSK